MIGHWRRRACQRRSVSSSAARPPAPAEVHARGRRRRRRPAPDDLAGLADALDRAAAQAEVHRRLALARRRPAADEVRRRGGPLISKTQTYSSVVPVPVAPAEVVQRVLERLAHRLCRRGRSPARRGRALVHLVEVRQRLAPYRARDAVAAAHRRPLGVVEQALDEVGRRAAGPSGPAGTGCRSCRSRSRRRCAAAATYILHCSGSGVGEIGLLVGR